MRCDDEVIAKMTKEARQIACFAASFICIKPVNAKESRTGEAACVLANSRDPSRFGCTIHIQRRSVGGVKACVLGTYNCTGDDENVMTRITAHVL